MLKLLRAQLIKVFLRNDVKSVLIIFAVLPISISFLISIESGIIQIGDSVFTGMGYASVVVGLLNSLLLINVTMALITTSLVSKEIDCGLDYVHNESKEAGKYCGFKVGDIRCSCANIVCSTYFFGNIWLVYFFERFFFW